MNLIDTLSQQRKGKFLSDASEALAEIVKACRETGKKGTLTIKLKLKPTASEMMLTDEIKADLPKPDAAASVFYDDENGGLHRDDPNQEDLPFATMPAQTQNSTN